MNYIFQNLLFFIYFKMSISTNLISIMQFLVTAVASVILEIAV